MPAAKVHSCGFGAGADTSSDERIWYHHQVRLASSSKGGSAVQCRAPPDGQPNRSCGGFAFPPAAFGWLPQCLLPRVTGVPMRLLRRGLAWVWLCATRPAATCDAPQIMMMGSKETALLFYPKCYSLHNLPPTAGLQNASGAVRTTALRRPLPMPTRWHAHRGGCTAGGKATVLSFAHFADRNATADAACDRAA